MVCGSGFRDNGPRFLIASVLSALLHFIFFFVLKFAKEDAKWFFWYGMSAVVTGIVNLAALHTPWRETRYYGDFLGLASLFHYGHFWSSCMLQNENYSGSTYKLKPFTPIVHLLLAALMTYITLWHKKIVCPRNLSDPSHMDNQERPGSWKIFKYSLGPMAAMVYGFAESRFGTGRVPAGHFIEALYGIATACIMLGLYYRRYRRSAWGSLVSMVWGAVTILMFIISVVLYFSVAKGRSEKFQYGVSMVSCLIITVLFFVAFSFKFWLLGEPLYLNFNAPPVDAPKRRVTNLSGTVDLESPTSFGISRSEAEATARKLGFNEPDYVRNVSRLTEATITGDDINGSL